MSICKFGNGVVLHFICGFVLATESSGILDSLLNCGKSASRGIGLSINERWNYENLI